VLKYHVDNSLSQQEREKERERERGGNRESDRARAILASSSVKRSRKVVSRMTSYG